MAAPVAALPKRELLIKAFSKAGLSPDEDRYFTEVSVTQLLWRVVRGVWQGNSSGSGRSRSVHARLVQHNWRL
jgi:hypothetical protein